MDGPGSQRWELKLLGFWQLKLDGQPVAVGIRQQRVIAALALLGARSRHSLSSLLWPDSSEAQAAGNLRASVFHITHKLPSFLCASNDSLFLEPDVEVDFHRIRWLIADIQDSAATVAAGSADILHNADLLPDWYDDWVIFEQERLQQLRLDGLETLANYYLRMGALGRATEAAHAATSIEPLRESAQLILLRCHLEAGNNASATRAFHEFRGRLGRELGVRPSSRFAELLDPQPTSTPPSAESQYRLPRAGGAG
ncbi:bacterial transcriptional activator domain-containing protein [Paenarthrobacter sp. PH39-S1]|uniref:AfsR/SARP family transcriptional regulator n=1 Tax=Paenarthrobacter sp. PH39-S1 TaxID=3046204 RepID=UPI0024B9B837|nr:bacterial transcriptional activator domain-containing protein [Paenarthrobacter sp. PH39-S1]MDJ0354957.1 bacterial transcriptional activator domain-containing protein [Paenarthrobacter sp. PH39-S1]